MLVEFPGGSIREWRTTDLDRLVRYGNNRKIWRNLRDRFPSPYTREAGEAWISYNLIENPQTTFVIAIDDELIGSIGVILGSDIYARSGEIGYWIGEEYWGRGIATQALRAFAPWAFAQFNLMRLWAAVFVENVGSARALEKAGFTREAHFRQAAVKEGRVLDEWVYSRVRDV
jgi:RimJ/RimL family protein N-acetyltransferase